MECTLLVDVYIMCIYVYTVCVSYVNVVLADVCPLVVMCICIILLHINHFFVVVFYVFSHVYAYVCTYMHMDVQYVCICI